MDKELVAKYLNKLKNETGLTIEAIARKSGRSESSVKNLLYANVDDPRLDTVTPVVYALNGSIDEMLNPGKSKDELKEVSVAQLREMYEMQVETIRQTSETHITNIRSHYEQHHEDLRENYEMRLADKRDLIESLKKECLHSKILSWVCVIILVSILVAEVMNPELGWIQF